MKKNISVALIATLLVAIFIVGSPQEIYANNYIDGEITIDEIFVSGDLGTVIETVHSDLGSITSLTITEGIVNANDFSWIRENLLSIEKLEIIGNSTVDSGDTPVDIEYADNIVPENALPDMANLKEIIIPLATEIGAYAFKSCSKLESISLPKVKTVGERAFGWNYELNNVNLPEATTIGDYAFYQCEFLREVSLPKVITVGKRAFYGWNELASISLPEATTIGDNAFYQCNNLREVSLPNVTTIGVEAFSESPLLKNLTLGAILPNIGSDAFSNISMDSLTVRVPYGSASSYLSDESDGDGTDNKWYGWSIYEVSNDTTLSGLGIGTETLDLDLNPTFDSDTTEYNATVTHDTYIIFVTPTVNDTKATVTVNGDSEISGQAADVRLSVGTNEISIVVTAEDNSTAETIVTVTREGNDDTTLSGLSITEGTLDPTFDSSITAYTAYVANDVPSIKVTPTVNDSNATVKVEGKEVTSGEAEEVTLDAGINEINIVVIAEDGSSTAETVITVTKAADATLKDLSISEGTLDPIFDSSITAYSVDVSNDVEVIKVTPIVNDSNATVAVNEIEITSGTAVEVELSVGINEIDIAVTAEDDSISETVITVRRAISLTIDETFTSGSLRSVIETGVEADDFDLITSLIIKKGVVNADDIKWIGEKLTRLESLRIIENATVDSGTDPSVDIDSADNTVPSNTVNYDVLIHLREITISSATAVDADAFLESGIESVILPKVITVGESAFEWNVNLTSISLPSATTIGDSAFFECMKLKSVYLPNVNTVGKEVFGGCSLLNDLTLGATVPSIGLDTFSGISTDSPTVRVPYGSATHYLNDTYDGDHTDNRWYGWTVYEISNDAMLSDLSISAGTLDRGFDSSINAYTVNVANSVTSIEVTPTANNNNAKVTVEGEEVISGAAKEVILSEGINEINIMTIAEDGVTTVDTKITVVRANSSNSSSILDNTVESEESIIEQPESEESIVEQLEGEESIIEQLEREDTEGVIEVKVEDNETISEDVFKALKEEGAKLIIDGDWYQWEFDGQSDVEEGISADFEPSIKVIDKDEIDIELEDDAGFIVKTKYEGKLPIKAKLKVKVDEFTNDDQTVYLYYYNEATGKLELSGTAVNKKGQAEFEITHCSIYTITEKPALKEGYEEIAYVSGYSDGAFRPDKSLSRAEAAVMLSRLLESEGIQGESGYSDTDMWAEEEIVILSELNVINGYSDDTFKPNDGITRGELATMMSKVLGLDINQDLVGFTDTKGHWAENAIIALRKYGIVNGYSDGCFKPDNMVTRVEAIAMINRALNRVSEKTKAYDNPFSDIDNNHWAFYLIMNAAGQ